MSDSNIYNKSNRPGFINNISKKFSTQKYGFSAFTFNTIAAVVFLSLAGPNTAEAKPNIPSDLGASPLSFATGTTTDFSQQMLRFEEFSVQPVPVTPEVDRVKSFPMPLPTLADPTACTTRPDAAAMDTFLDAPLWPNPTMESNEDLINPWSPLISSCLGFTVNGNIEGRPPGVSFGHQRWAEFPPAVAFQTAMGGARTSGGRLDDTQSHGYAVGEFAPGGLYNNTVGSTFPPFPDGTTAGIGIKFHPNMPIQAPNSLWTFGDGTLPPKLLRARYAQPIVLRHFDALPVRASANNGFGEHTITTHEHNGHNPGESDGFAGAFFFPGQFYDYRWPMQLAGYDSINTNASDPRASTPCSLGETLMIADPITGVPIPKLCDPVSLTVNIAGDWHETMSTHWFHDHMIDRTSENVYKGNAAMMNYYSGIDRGKEGFQCEYANPNNVNLCFPSGTALDWGNRDYDVQLLIADKAWSRGDGQLDMAVMNEEGFLADRMTVNWLYKPYMDVRARRYRFRVLNGAVARFMKHAIVREFNDATTGDMPGPAGSNKSYSRVPFHMIANDGNIMEHAVAFPNAQSNDMPMQAIAERYDVIIDFAQYPEGTKIFMVNTAEHDNGKRPKSVIPLATILDGTYVAIGDFTAGCDANCWDNDPTVGKFLEFRVQAYAGTDLSMNPADYEVGKKMMIPLVNFTDAELAAAIHRTFEFGNGGGISTDGRPIAWAISTDGGANLSADVSRVSAAPTTMGDPLNGVPASGVEIWHIVNQGGGWAHPVHVHFEEGQYLARVSSTGIKSQPPLWEIGARKDMYRVSGLGEDAFGNPAGLPDSSMAIDVAIRFREFAGTFVEHCHNTTHEDKAMLLRWDNEIPGQTIRIPTPMPNWERVDYVGTSQLATIKTGNSIDPLTALPYVSPPQLIADLNGTGAVNLADYGIFRSHWRLQGLWGGNFNEDANVNLADYGIFSSDWRKSNGLLPAMNNPVP